MMNISMCRRTVLFFVLLDIIVQVRLMRLALPESERVAEVVTDLPGSSVRKAKKAPIVENVLLSTRKPIPGEKTLGLFGKLYEKQAAGFRNGAMAFQAFVLYAQKHNYTQILLSSLKWKDLYGTMGEVGHEELFDVDHWNSFYPKVPRLVDYDATLFTDFDLEKRFSVVSNAEKNATKPYAHGRWLRLFNQYRRYTEQVERGKIAPHPTALAMKKALRPHPDMMKLLHQITKDHNNGGSYMALHARVEPDMQKHPACRDKKVLRLSEIFEALEKKFQKPPVESLFVAVNRPLLEQQANDFDKYQNKIAVENLATLNKARKEGLWKGMVKVLEAGMPSVAGSRFEKYPGISGAMMDYFLAKESDIFVGTEVSSFSVELIDHRFYNNQFKNFFYRPEDIVLATNVGDTGPPYFAC